MNGIQLLEMFRLSKTISVKDGEILLMQTPVCFALTRLLANLQKGLIESMGFEKAYFQLYETNKVGSKAYNVSFIQKEKFTDKRKVLDWQVNIVTLGGWGKFEAIFLDLKENRLRIKFNNSPFPKIYGKSVYPVCVIAAGFTAGGASANFGVDVDALETMCVACGDPFCEIVFDSPKKIAEMRTNLWKKLGLV